MNHRFHPSEIHQSFGASAGLEVAGMNGFSHLQSEAYGWGNQQQHFRPCPPTHRPQPPCPGLPNLGFNIPHNGFNPGGNNFNQGYNNFNQGYNGFNPGGNNFNQGYNNFNQGYNNFNNPGYNNYNPLPPGTSLAIPQQYGANTYGDGVNFGTSSYAGNQSDGAAAWGASNPNGSSVGGLGWGTDAYGRTQGGGSMTFVAPDGSVGSAVLHSANGMGELDWRSSTGAGMIKWGPGYCNSYSLPLNPYNQRQCW